MHCHRATSLVARLRTNASHRPVRNANKFSRSFVQNVLHRQHPPLQSHQQWRAFSLKNCQVVIPWGSQSGTGRSFAETLGHELKSGGFKSKCVDLADMPGNKFELAIKEWQQSNTTASASSSDKEQLYVFVTASFGEGEPTDNAKDFYEWLMKPEREQNLLKGLKYTVFGLGNSRDHKEHYQAAAINIDQRLSELGAERVFRIGLGDDAGDIENDFDSWRKEFVTFIRQDQQQQQQQQSSQQPAQQQQQHQQSVGSWTSSLEPDPQEQQQPEAPDTALSISYGFDVDPLKESDDSLRIFNPLEEASAKNPYNAPVIQSLDLSPFAHPTRTTKHITLDLRGSNMHYRTGDYLCVYPRYRPFQAQGQPQAPNHDAVMRMTRRLNVNPDCTFVVQGDDTTSIPFADRPVTVRQVLEQYVDLCGQVPNSAVIDTLARFATKSEQRKKLLQLSRDQEAIKKLKNEHRTIVDLLEEYRSIELPWREFVVHVAPSLQIVPRTYSIASSASVQPDTVSIMVRQCTFQSKVHKDKTLFGLSSTYLTSISPINVMRPPRVTMFVRSSGFNLPDDPQTPVIFLAGGAGLAPFMGFLQEREYLMRTKGAMIGPSVLYFGSRNPNECLLADVLQDYVRKKVVGEVRFTFDEGGLESQRKFVSDRLRDDVKEVWSYIERGAYIYLCGPSAFGMACREALAAVFKYGTNCTAEQAMQRVSELKASKRYKEDIC